MIDPTHDVFSPQAIEHRQRQIIELVRTMKALALAGMVAFIALGALCIVLLVHLDDTRRVTKGLRDEQRAVVCDSYRINERTPPPEINCQP